MSGREVASDLMRLFVSVDLLPDKLDASLFRRNVRVEFGGARQKVICLDRQPTAKRKFVSALTQFN
jgi:hypothetical protein